MAGFTDKFIDGLKATSKRQIICEGRGFIIQVLAAAKVDPDAPKSKKAPDPTKRWLYRYTLNGVKGEIHLGNYPAMTLTAARLAYGKAFAKVAMKLDPKAPEAEVLVDDKDLTFKHFADLYIARSKTKHCDAWHKIVVMSLNKVIAAWGDKPIVSIRRRDGIKLMEELAAKPGQVKNSYKAMRAVFTYAVDRDYLDGNPMLGLADIIPELVPVTRKRILSMPELKHVWTCLSDPEKGDERIRAAIKLVLVTAQRPIEVSGLHWRQLYGKWWTMQADNVKNEVMHTVFLTPTALELIGDTQAHGYIFPSGRSKKVPKPISRATLSQFIVDHKYFGLPKWGPQDLRRTARTGMARLRVPEPVAEAVLNHKKAGVVKTYNLHEYDVEKQETMLLWEAELLRIVGGDKDEFLEGAIPLDSSLFDRIDSLVGDATVDMDVPLLPEDE